MKTTAILLAAFLSASTLFQSVASAEVLFREDFLNSSGKDAALNTVNWLSYRGATATPTDVTIASPMVPYIPNSDGHGTGRAFLSPGPTDRTSIFLYTSKIADANIDIADVGLISFQQRNNRQDNNLRFAIAIDSEWYVSATPFNSVNNMTWAAAEIHMADATWNTLTFDPENILSMGTAISLPTSGIITDIGLFSSSAQGAMRIDTIVVESIPETSTIAMLGGGLIAMLLLKSGIKLRK